MLMTEVGRPHLTVADVYSLGGWSRQYARVRALVTIGSFALSITDTNGDRVTLYVSTWDFGSDGWDDDGGIGTSYHRRGDIVIGQGSGRVEVSYTLNDSDAIPELSATLVGTIRHVVPVDA